jgi:hypothetical protein
MIDSDEDSRPVMLGWLADPSRVQRQFAPDAIYQRLFDEVFDNPDATRSHVITLHLYVEYWLNRILEKLGLSTNKTFHKKLEILNQHQVLEPPLAKNLTSINRLRNIYAHELDLSAATTRVITLIDELELDPYFRSTDPDPLRTVCIQVMFLLEATFHNDCKPPKLPQFPAAEARDALIKTGKLHWQKCEILSFRQAGYVEYYELRCPHCQKGTIDRERDGTPGFKDSFMSACQECGLTGDGYVLDYSTKND